MRVQLVPPDGGPPIDLRREISVVGRGAGADVRLEHKSVSKQHCVLVRTDGLVLVRDLGSTNGTRVNGQRVRRGALLPNDLVAFANFRFTLTFAAEPAAAAEPPAAAADDLEPDYDEPPKALPVAAPAVRRNALPDQYAP